MLSNSQLIDRFKKILASPASIPVTPPAALPPEALLASYVVTTDENPAGFETIIAYKQAEVEATASRLSAQITDLVTFVGHQTRFLTSRPVDLLPERLLPLSRPDVPPGPMRPESAAKWLADMTGNPWTMQLLHKLAKRLAWRAETAEEDKRLADARYFVEIYDTVSGYCRLVYTAMALYHVITDADACWALANEKG